MLPDNVIVFAVLEAVTGYVWITALCYVLWACTDMDLSWHKVRRLTYELEEALKETRKARDRAETQIRFLAGQNQCLQDMLFKERARRDYD